MKWIQCPLSMDCINNQQQVKQLPTLFTVTNAYVSTHTNPRQLCVCKIIIEFIRSSAIHSALNKIGYADSMQH